MLFPELIPYGWSDQRAEQYAAVATETSAPGRVLRHDGVAVVVARPDRIDHVALGNLGQPLAVGDWIVVELDTAVHLLPRATLLRRSIGDGSTEQLLAANVDVVAVVAGLDRPVKAGRLERFYRSALVMTFGGGTNEIQRDIIGYVGLGLPAAKR